MRFTTYAIPTVLIATLGMAVSLGGFLEKKAETQNITSPDTLYAMLPEDDFIDTLVATSGVSDGYVDDEEMSLIHFQATEQLSVLHTYWAEGMEKLEYLQGLYEELLATRESEYRLWNEQSSRLEKLISALQEEVHLLKETTSSETQYSNVIGEELQVELETHGRSLSELSEVVSLLEQKTNSLVETLSRLDSRNSEQVLRELRRLDKQLVLLSERIDDTKRLLDGQSNKTITLEESEIIEEGFFENALTDLSSQMEGVVTQIDTAESRLGEYYGHLEQRVQTLELYIMQHNARLVAVERVLSQAQNVLRQLEGKVTEMALTTENLEQQIDTSNRRIDILEREWERLFSEWETQLTHISADKEELLQIKEEILVLVETQDENIKQLYDVVEALNSDLGEFKYGLSFLSERDFQALDSADQIAAIAVAVSRLDSRIEEAHNTSLLLFEEISRLSDRLKDIEGDFLQREELLEASVVNLQNYVDQDIENTIHILEAKFFEADAQTVALQNEYQRLEQVVDVLMERVGLLENKSGRTRSDELQNIAQLAIETLLTTQELMATMSVEQEQLKRLLEEQGDTIELLRQELDELRYIQTGEKEVVSYTGGGTQ